MDSTRRLNGPGFIAHGAQIAFDLDDQRLTGLAGESIAAALTASGVLAYGRSPEGSPRGLGCGMGACFACIVEIEGVGPVRACMTGLTEGMRLRSGRDGSPVPCGSAGAGEQRCDIAVVGAGPAGLSAALRLAEAGLAVIVLDERPSPGGQYFKPLASSHGFAGPPADTQFREGLALAAAARQAGAAILSAATVWDAARQFDEIRLGVVHEGAALEIMASAMIIATGAVERPWIIPGWTLPGAMSTGAAQTLARTYRVAPGKRIVICGNGPLNLQLAAELVAGGAQVAAVVEAADSPWASPAAAAAMTLLRPGLTLAGSSYLARLRGADVPVLHKHILVAIEGDDCVEGAIIARLGQDGRPIEGSQTRIAADCVTMGYGFQPADELARLLGCPPGDPRRDGEGRTNIAGVYAAGDCSRVRGAAMAIVDGELAAAAVLADRGRTVFSDAAIGRRRREAGFQNALWRMFAATLPPPGALSDDDTIICRCEGIRKSAITPALPLGSVAALKRATRCGMGLCQGRYCLPVVAAMLPEAKVAPLPTVQPPLRPVQVSHLTGLPPPEPVLQSAAPSRIERHEPRLKPHERHDCGVLVIGGGVVGLCTAHSLALAGEDVVLIESHGGTGVEASGANAGSLHVQSLAYAFSDFDSPAAALSLRMLPLQRDSVRLWQDIAAATGSDFEIKVSGGICLAHSQNDLARLAEKVRRERAAGIAVDLLDASEVRARLDGVADGVTGASFSPDEGKLNPLLALPMLHARAVQAGVRIITSAPVTGLTREGSRFRAVAAARAIDAGRVVLTAGTGVGPLAGMLGQALTIQATPLQMTVTERVAWPLDMLVSHVTQRLTLKQAASGNLIVGGGWRAVRDADGRARVTPRGLGANLRLAAEALPAIGAAQVLRTWTAVNALPTAGPLVGPLPGARGCYVAVALNGLTLGPVLGQIMADLVRGRPSQWDIAPFDPGRAGTAA